MGKVIGCEGDKQIRKKDELSGFYNASKAR
jgi:hypothetical protein